MSTLFARVLSAKKNPGSAINAGRGNIERIVRSMRNKPAAREAQEPSTSAPKKKDKFNRFAWRDAVFADPKTPLNAKCLAFGIAKFVDGETGEAYPSTVTLAEVCGCAQRPTTCDEPSTRCRLSSICTCSRRRQSSSYCFSRLPT